MNLPKPFIERTLTLLSEEFDAFEKALSTDSPISIRINRFKTNEQLSFQQIPWCKDAYYLNERPNFTFDPLFHAGCYYVQEASSMFLEKAVKQHIKGAECVLDLCAAPGGKSTHFRTLLPNNCLLVSNEIIRNRSYILAENLIKWGHPNIVVTQNSPSDLGKLTHFFDAIVVDAPCSGEGMFRKDSDSMNEWSEYNVQQCALRQQQIIDDIWDALKPGGIMIYSTCTYNLEENEHNLAYITQNYDAEILPIDIESQWNITRELDGKLPSYRFFPHKTNGEGFFLAVIQKSDSENRRVIKPKKNKQAKKPSTFPSDLKSWIINNSDFNFAIENNSLVATNKLFENQIDILSNKCSILHKGINIAEIKGHDFVPTHNLAMSNILNSEIFSVCEVDITLALSFLKTEVLKLPDNQPKGYILLTYLGHPIGWVKNIGSRANNLYPNQWRIRSSYNPEEIKSFWT
ncbi:MAG: methyltransferase RsmF C-terminal domain-like protein [Bacteroidales bacterium]